MKTKTILYSNFKFNPINNDNNVVIEKTFNVKSDNNFISTDISSNNVLLTFFNDSICEEIGSKNLGILNKTKEFIPYSVFDETLQKYILRLFIITNDNILYELNQDTLIFENKYNFSGYPSIIYEDSLLYLFDNNCCIVISDSSSLQVEQIPQIKSYLKTKEKIYFCINNYPTFIFETDICLLKDLSINLGQYQKYSINSEYGKIIKITKLRNKIYIVTEYAILQLEDNNNLTHILSTNLKIYNEAVIQIDNTLILFTSNGLYYFDGDELNYVFNNSFNIDKNAKLICFNRNLYIFNAVNKNIVIKYNLNEKLLSLIKLDGLENLYILKINYCYNLCACILEDNKYKNISLYNNNPDSYFNQKIVFKLTNFDSTSNKQIKNISFKAEGNFKFTIKSEFSSVTYDINSDTQLKNICIDGSVFHFEISSNTNFRLDSFLVTYLEDNSL